MTDQTIGASYSGGNVAAIACNGECMTADTSTLRQAATAYRQAVQNVRRARRSPKIAAPHLRAAAEQERAARQSLHAAIVAAVQSGLSQAAASRIAGLSTPHVCRLVRGVSSGRVTPPPSTRTSFAQRVPLAELAGRYKAGETVADLAEAYECSTTTIRDLLERCGVGRRGAYIQLPVASKELARRYLEGREQIQDLAAEFNVNTRTISARLATAGVRVPLGARRLALPDAEIVERHRNGERLSRIAASYNVSVPAITRRIRENAARTLQES